MAGLEDYDRSGNNMAETVVDPALLSLANAGEDWFCRHCTAGNGGTGSICRTCAAPRYDDATWPADEQTNEYQPRTDLPPPPRVQQPHVSWEDSPPPTPARKPSLTLALALAIKPSLTLALVIIVNAALCGGLFAAWALQTHEDEGHISAMTWTQNTILQRWSNVVVREWRHKITERQEIPPVGGQGERSGKELMGGTCAQEHYDDERYQCGTREQCTPRTRSVKSGESCTSTDNGFARCSPNYRSVPDGETCHTVPKYCTRPIYRARCDYRMQIWKTSRTATDSGAGTDTRWPPVDVGMRDRRRFSVDYDVIIQYTDGGSPEVYTHKPAAGFLGFQRELDVHEALKAEAEYRSWSIDEVVTLDVNNLGHVHGVKHGGIPIENVQAGN